MLRTICIASNAMPGQLSSARLAGTQRMSAAEAKKLKSPPVPYTRKSIAQGRTAFARYCTPCHGPDGKAQSGRGRGCHRSYFAEAYKSGTSGRENFP